MGCGNSKNQVHVASEPVPAAQRNLNNANRKQIQGKNKVEHVDSCSIDSQNREGSATSKASRHSGDSGFDDEDEQRSKAALLRPSTMSAKSERLEERQLLETLHEEGLIQRPIGRGTFGVSFEVMSELGGTIRRPPPRLAKLECKKKKKKVLTQEEIREKLERAEQRRKEQEQQRLNKIHSLQRTDIQGALDTFVQTQKDLEVAAKSKEEIAAENREKKLREKLERLRAKEAHAEAVRQRKLAAALQQQTNFTNEGDDMGQNSETGS
jgi:hypothetical protein